MFCIKCRITSQVLYPIMQKYFPWQRLLHSSTSGLTPLEENRLRDPETIYKRLAAVIILLKQQIEALLCCQLKQRYRRTKDHFLHFFLCLDLRSQPCTHIPDKLSSTDRHTSIHTLATRIHPPPQPQKWKRTHAQTVWSVNLVPWGARRVTPLTGQTRPDSQQTDKY